MRKLKETVSDVSFLISEWDYDANIENGLYPERLGSQSNIYAYWRCRYGHHWKAKINNRYNGRGCPECNKGRRTSFPEQALFFYVKKIFPDAINSYREIFDNQMELDIYIPSINTGIEYDGVAWHKDKGLKREALKYEKCRQIAIRLIRIKENIENCSSEDCLADIIIPTQIFGNNKKDYPLLDITIRQLINLLSSESESIIVNTWEDKGSILENYLSELEGKSLETHSPDVARQWHPTRNGKLTPKMFSPHSNKKVWWMGDCGHEWEAAITVRTRGNGCPYCSGASVLKGFNDFQTKFPDLAMQWHPTKNGDETPDMFTFGSGHYAYWLCPNCQQDWRARINMRTTNKRGCPYCAHEKAIKGVNDLFTIRPDLLEEWDYEKNQIDPSELLVNSHKRAWWVCKQCGFKYSATISNRSKGTGCRQCAGQVLIPGKNDLLTIYPEIANEWDTEKNNGISASQVFAHSNRKFYWICKYGHSWATTVNNRAGGKGCPICSGNIVLTGFNDLETTHPHIAKLLHPTMNNGLLPTQISKGYSKGKLWWLCPECNKAYDSYLGNLLKGYGKCPYCSPRKTNGKCVIQVETGRSFKTLEEAALSIGKTDIRLIQMCCTGRCKTAYGYHWEYRSD